jgi:hypothetical protein
MRTSAPSYCGTHRHAINQLTTIVTWYAVLCRAAQNEKAAAGPKLLLKTLTCTSMLLLAVTHCAVCCAMPCCVLQIDQGGGKPKATVENIDMHLNMLRSAVANLGGAVEVASPVGWWC